MRFGRTWVIWLVALAVPAGAGLGLVASGCGSATCADFGTCESAGDASPPIDARVDSPVEASPEASSDAGTCLAQAPDDVDGVFVSPAGLDGQGCGTTSSPCKTIAQGLILAATNHKSILYLDRGFYGESVALDVLNNGAASPFTIQGGWSDLLGQWTPICQGPDADVPGETTVQGPVTIGSGSSLTVTLSSLAIGAGAQSSMSLMGGASTVVLKNVEMKTIIDAGTD
jgi:hypothetical protein